MINFISNTFSRLLRFWFNKIPRIVKYILVGGWNTVFSVLFFALIIFLIGKLNYKFNFQSKINVYLILIFNYFVTVFHNTLTFGIFVFQKTDHIMKRYFKSLLSYLLYLISNMLLFLIIQKLFPKLNLTYIQIINVIILTIPNYFVLKKFPFL